MLEKPRKDTDQWNLRTVLYRSEFLDWTAEGFILYNDLGVIVDCNQAVLEWLNTTRNDFIGQHFSDLQWGAVQEDGSPFATHIQPAVVTRQSGRPSLGVLMGVDFPKQARRWLSINTYPVMHDGDVKGVISSYNDVTEKIQRNHMLNLLTEVNRSVMYATNEAELLQHLCRAFVEVGGYALAWIGAPANEAAGDVEVLFAAGVTDYLYEGIVSALPSRPLGLGPTGTALRTGRSQVVNDLANHPHFAPWRDRAAHYGLASGISLPFSFGRPAVLNVYDRHIIAFDDVTARGLEEILREIEFGAAHVRSVQQTVLALHESKAATAALREAETARTQSDQRFLLAFEDNMAPMVFSDLEDRAIAVNDSFCRMVGFTKEELLGLDSKQYTLPDDIGITEEIHSKLLSDQVHHVRYVKRYRRKDGRVIVSEVSRSAARDENGELLYFVASERDITEERELTAQLSHQALHDPLTGLANRALFEDRLNQSYARVEREGGLNAVLLLDLDDFKGVNDTHGHVVGDQLLVGIARRFALVTRATDTLCRLGGDEFLYLAEGLNTVEEAEEVARRLLDVLTEPFSFDQVHLSQHASIGIVVFDGSNANIAECMQEADAAMYEAKRADRGHYLVFNAGMRERAVRRFTLVQELRQALVIGELSMHYQPIVDLATSDIVGFEALMRWWHPGRGWVPPNVFIPLAEQSDLILELGSFAFREAVAAATSWKPSRLGGTRPYVAVNLSARQFLDPGLVSFIASLLAQSALTPASLIIEITESVTLVDIDETLGVMERLAHHGIGIALDDFGTGYSSLSYLTLLHPRIIKIDQAFVSPTVETERNNTLLDTIVTLGHRLGTTVLGEGIETSVQLERLRELGCELGQGFLFSPAVPANEVAALLVQWEDTLKQSFDS